MVDDLYDFKFMRKLREGIDVRCSRSRCFGDTVRTVMSAARRSESSPCSMEQMSSATWLNI